MVVIDSDSSTGIANVETVYSPTPDEIVYGVEVFKHYMVVLVDKNKQRQLKCINLRTNKLSTHFFDSPLEVNQHTKQISEFFDVNLEDNYSFDNH